MAYSVRQRDVWEILEEFDKAAHRYQKIAVLEKHKNNIALRDVCQGSVDDRVVWLIPAGTVPYTPSRPESAPATLLNKNREFQYFHSKGPGRDLPAVRRESMFLSLLESIHPKDAQIVVKMINKENLTKGLTKKIIIGVWPNLGIK